MTAGDCLRLIRKRAGETQHAMAARLGYSKTHVLDLERGHTPLSPDAAWRVRLEYGLDPLLMALLAKGLDPARHEEVGRAAAVANPGAVLKLLRKRAGHTQAEAARLLGVSDTNVSAVENGSRAASDVLLGRAEAAYGVNPLLAAMLAREEVDVGRYREALREAAAAEAETGERAVG